MYADMHICFYTYKIQVSVVPSTNSMNEQSMDKVLTFFGVIFLYKFYDCMACNYYFTFAFFSLILKYTYANKNNQQYHSIPKASINLLVFFFFFLCQSCHHYFCFVLSLSSLSLLPSFFKCSIVKVLGVIRVSPQYYYQVSIYTVYITRAAIIFCDYLPCIYIECKTVKPCIVSNMVFKCSAR